jgi:hypothetical protein
VTSIAIISPDGNKVINLSGEVPFKLLQVIPHTHPRVTRTVVKRTIHQPMGPDWRDIIWLHSPTTATRMERDNVDLDSWSARRVGGSPF